MKDFDGFDGWERVLPGKNIVRTTADTSNKVRIAFPTLKGKIRMVVEFGRLVCRKLDFNIGDRVSIYTKPNQLWFVKTTVDDPAGSWTLFPANPKSDRSNLRIAITWKTPIPKGCDHHMRFVNESFLKGGLLIDLPGYDPKKEE